MTLKTEDGPPNVSPSSVGGLASAEAEAIAPVASSPASAAAIRARERRVPVGESADTISCPLLSADDKRPADLPLVSRMDSDAAEGPVGRPYARCAWIARLRSLRRRSASRPCRYASGGTLLASRQRVRRLNELRSGRRRATARRRRWRHRHRRHSR